VWRWKSVGAAILISLIMGGPVLGWQNRKAQRVLDLIAFLEKERLSPLKSSQLRKIIVTEEEFNAYLEYRLAREKEEMMKSLQLKFLPRNRLEGKLVLDFSQQKVKPGLSSRMIFYFGGRLLIKEGKGKFDLQKLFLNNQPLPPNFLDALLALAAKIKGEEYSSLTDWYELPLGIKNIQLLKGKAIIFY